MPYSMLLMLPRRPDLTPEQFREHYENGHVPLINSLCEDPNLRPILYKRTYFVAELMGPSGTIKSLHPNIRIAVTCKAVLVADVCVRENV